MEKQVKFGVIKEKIIKTDELIRLFKQKSDDLQRISLINKQYKTKLEQRKNEIDKIKLESNVLTTRTKTTDSKYKSLSEEHEHLKHKYNELEQEYFTKINDHQIKFQTVSQELVECRDKLTQYEKLQNLDVTPSKKTSKTNNNQQINGLKLQYSMLEQEFKDLQKEHDLVVKALKKTEEQLQKVNSQTTKKEHLKCDQKTCSFYKDLANVQLDNYNLRKQISDLKILEDNLENLRHSEQKHEDQQKELDSIKSKHEQKLEEILNLNLKLQQYQSENDKLQLVQQENGDKNRIIESLSNEIDLLKQQNDVLLKNNNDMKEQLTQLSNQIREMNATPSDGIIDDIMKEMHITNILTPFEKELELKNDQIIVNEPTKLSTTTSGDFVVSNINEELSKICDNSRNIIRQRKRRRIKKKPINVDLLAALKALTEANIKFTISNESAVTTLTNNNRINDFPASEKTKSRKQKVDNKTDFLTRKLDCNLECCNGFSSYCIMKNDDNLLGFLNIKNEINSKLFPEDFLKTYQNDKPIITRDCVNSIESSPVLVTAKQISESVGSKLSKDWGRTGCTRRSSLRLSSPKNSDNGGHELRRSPRNMNPVKRNTENPSSCSRKDLNQQLIEIDEYSPIVKKKRLAHARLEENDERFKKVGNKVMSAEEIGIQPLPENEVSLTITENHVGIKQTESKTDFKRPVCNRRLSLRLSNLFNDEDTNHDIGENVHSSKEQAISSEQIAENPIKIAEKPNNNVEIEHNLEEQAKSRRSSRLSDLFNGEDSCGRAEHDSSHESNNCDDNSEGDMSPQSPPPVVQGKNKQITRSDNEENDEWADNKIISTGETDVDLQETEGSVTITKNHVGIKENSSDVFNDEENSCRNTENESPHEGIVVDGKSNHFGNGSDNDISPKSSLQNHVEIKENSSDLFNDEENSCRNTENESAYESIVIDEKSNNLGNSNDNDDISPESSPPSPIDQHRNEQTAHNHTVLPEEISIENCQETNTTAIVVENPVKVPELSCNNVGIEHNLENESKAACNRRRSLRLSNLFSSSDESNNSGGDSEDDVTAQSPQPMDQDKTKPIGLTNEDKIGKCIKHLDDEVISTEKHGIEPLPETEVSDVNIEIQQNLEKEVKTTVDSAVCSRRQSLRLSILVDDEDSCATSENQSSSEESNNSDDDNNEDDMARVNTVLSKEIGTDNRQETIEIAGKSNSNVEVKHNLEEKPKASVKRPVYSRRQFSRLSNLFNDEDSCGGDGNETSSQESNSSDDDIEDHINPPSPPPPPIDQSKKNRIAYSRKVEINAALDHNQIVALEIPAKSSKTVEIKKNLREKTKTSFKRPVCTRRQSLRLSNLFKASCRKSKNESTHQLNNCHDNAEDDTSPQLPQMVHQGTKKRIAHSRKEQQNHKINDNHKKIALDHNYAVASDQITEIKIPEKSPDTIEIKQNVAKAPKTSYKRPICSKRQTLQTLDQCEDDMNPQSPPSIDQGTINCDIAPKIIPLEKVGKMPPSKVKVLLEKLILYSAEEMALEEVVQQFTTQDPKYIARIILERVVADRYGKPDSKYTPPAPLLTEIQRILLGFMVALEHNNVEIYEDFLTLSEQYLFLHKDLHEILAITRLYLSVCKVQRDIHRVRRLCCEMFYFNYDYAVPFFFVILTSWTEVLPHEIDSKAIPLARILVQNVYISTCNQPGYNLLPLRDLLIKYYGYPSERWNSDELFEEFYNIYRNNPVRSSDFNLLLLCKNHPEKWVNEKIHKYLIPLLDEIPVDNVKAAVIILIGNLSYNFSTNTEYLKNIREWMNSLLTETTPHIVRRAVCLCLRRLTRKRKKKS